MKRTAILRRTRMRARRRRTSAAERTAYSEATDAARTPEGYLVCEFCGASIRDGDEARHHTTFRSQGGKTTVDNIAVVHSVPCHEAIHAHRPVERMEP